MSPEHPAADNLRCLQQGIDVIRRLDDPLYAGGSRSTYRGVGAQFRHCIDFYACFLRGLPEGRIDYACRDRDHRVEVDREHAAERIEATIAGLRAFDPDSLDGSVEVRLEPPLVESSSGSTSRGWCGSSRRRELQFLLSHTIHHYALITALLELEGCELGEEFADFGVAPSTLGHLRRSAS